MGGGVNLEEQVGNETDKEIRRESEWEWWADQQLNQGQDEWDKDIESECEWMLLGKTIMLQFLVRAMNLLLTHNTPETNHDSGNTGEKRRVVGGLVTA